MTDPRTSPSPPLATASDEELVGLAATPSDVQLLTRQHVARMEDAASRGGAGFEHAVAAASVALWRDLPLLEPPDLVGRLHALLSADAIGRAAEPPVHAPRS